MSKVRIKYQSSASSAGGWLRGGHRSLHAYTDYKHYAGEFLKDEADLRLSLELSRDKATGNVYVYYIFEACE